MPHVCNRERLFQVFLNLCGSFQVLDLGGGHFADGGYTVEQIKLAPSMIKVS